MKHNFSEDEKECLTTAPADSAIRTNSDAANISSNALLELSTLLLRFAVCPCCDGSGTIATQTSYRQLVTREMALDAGCPEMEGLLYSDDEWEQQQCQWCDERRQVMQAYDSQFKAQGEEHFPAAKHMNTPKDSTGGFCPLPPNKAVEEIREARQAENKL